MTIYLNMLLSHTWGKESEDATFEDMVTVPVQPKSKRVIKSSDFVENKRRRTAYDTSGWTENCQDQCGK
jgi:hypothetical protein